MARRRILVLLDNARDSSQVLPLLPGSPGCLTLVTSRNRLSSLKVTSGAGSVDLRVLTDSESALHFSRRVGSTPAAAEAAMREIVRCCSGLPPAIDIAAAHAVCLPMAAPDHLAQELRDPRTRLDALDAGDVSTNLRALFTSSHQALDPESARVFRLMGLAPHQDIALLALAHLVDRTPARTRQALRVLQEACLVRQHIPGRYHLHDLVRLYAEEQAAALPRDLHDQLAERLVDFYVRTAHAAHRVLDPHRTAEDPLPTDPPHTAPQAFEDADSALARFETEYAALQDCRDCAPPAPQLRCVPPDLGHAHVPPAARSLHGKHSSLALGPRSGHRARRPGEGQAATWDTLGCIARHTGRTERALHAYGQVLLHFQSIENASREADTWSKLGDIHAERGEDAPARAAWTTALTLYRRQGRSSAADRMTTNLSPDPRAD
ncbi:MULTISPECIES: hypothetical protein [unclassified Streptomyces]|uniref:hypothetical protein n=1 Tax=unclassified Streptomyces TaxID=2593676 RepID=UPI0036EAC09E